MNLLIVVSLTLTAALLGFLSGYACSARRIKRQIRALGQTLEGMMRGDFTADLTPLREGDVGVLAGQLELACKRMNHLVAQLSREKTAIKDFMTDVSHQLKTPLTALLTYLELLQGETDGRRREQLDRCVLLAARMDELTRALLDFARLEADATLLRVEPQNLTETVRAAMNAVRDAHPRRADFRLTAPGLVEARFDEKWLRQALFNLIKNAADHAGEPPVVTVTVQPGDGAARVTVRDNGPGVDAADLPRIFERFYRAKNSASGGLGIGLPLAREIVRRHHGDIRAVQEDSGTAFVVTLPALNCVEKTEN